jgi:hypothetical protein
VDAVVTFISVALALFGIFVAFWVPIQMERHKRPVLTIEPYDSAAGDLGGVTVRFAKIRVQNLPLGRDESPWYFPRIDTWLSRATATGCKVTASFEEIATGARPVPDVELRWDATAEPLNLYVTADGRHAADPDITKLPQSLRFDVAPDRVGEALAIGIKYAGEESAFAFGAWSYFGGGPRLYGHPAFELAGDEYLVTIRATAGGASATRTVRLRNYGRDVHDFRVVPE